MEDESALTIARKRRHLFLLQKVRENKPLSRAETSELEQYEEPMGKKSAPVKEKAGRVKGKPAAVKGTDPAVQPQAGIGFLAATHANIADVRVPAKKATPTCLKVFALQFETMAEVENVLGIEDLAAQLEGNKRLAQAWERGRKLRGIRELAATPICMAEASQRLGMGEDGLLKLYKRDPEVRDLWDRAKIDMVVRLKQGLMERACAANANAIRTVEKILEGEFGGAGGPAAEVDFAQLTPTQMEAATGFPRQTILRWHRKHGLPRNADGKTYSLPQFVGWHQKFEEDKLTRTVGTAGVDPLREQKARKAKIEADLLEGRAVAMEVHERRILERAHVVKNLLSPDRAEEWAALHEGRTALQLKDMYLEAFEQVLVEFCRRVDVGVPLPPAVQAKLDEAFALMKGNANE